MSIKYFEKSMLNDVTDLCRKSMYRDEINSNLLREKIIDDPDFHEQTTLCFEENGKLTGFIMGVIRKRETESIGYVKLLAVHPDYQRSGIATKLYKQVEENFKQNGIKKIRAFESWTNYYMPGIDPFYTEAICFFERNKFKKVGDTSNLSVELQGSDFSTDEEVNNLAGNGILIKRAEQKDFNQLIEWTRKNFAAWEGEIRNSFKNNPPTIHIAIIGEEIIAFSAHEANNFGLGWFGPMGTTEAARGKGVGGVLLKRCIEDMQKSGYRKAIIPWVGPIPFYMHYIGSRVDRVFWRYERVFES